MIRKKLHIYIIAAVLLFFSACGVTSHFSNRNLSNPGPVSKGSEAPAAISISSYSEVQLSLNEAYQDWKGTPYEWGGATIQGVDCSAFMQILFNRYLGVELPRTTKQQIYTGTTVNRRHLRPGDLIFFKTGRKTLHVGVIIKNKKFLHASTSQGVTISSLKNYYWRSRFLTAKRVL